MAWVRDGRERKWLVMTHHFGKDLKGFAERWTSGTRKRKQRKQRRTKEFCPEQPRGVVMSFIEMGRTKRESES